MAEPPASPCTRICCLDEADVCIGCGRTLDEIRRWSDMPDQIKRETLQLAADRRAERQRRFPGLQRHLDHGNGH
ncbi:MAG: DUF1289 domain-containing protein [Gammaproteobacteria bacterium]|nr:DUF1289 domain-containing protein [Gammaproteobacteria bacterium]